MHRVIIIVIAEPQDLCYGAKSNDRPKSNNKQLPLQACIWTIAITYPTTPSVPTTSTLCYFMTIAAIASPLLYIKARTTLDALMRTTMFILLLKK